MDQQAAKILIVDDEQDNLDFLRRALRRDFEVHTAQSGAEGIQLLQEHSFAIVMSDQRMPQMTGVEFLFRSIEYAPHACRIMITGYSDEDATIEAINMSQVSIFLRKPVTVDALRNEFKRSLECFQLRDRAYCLVAEMKHDRRHSGGGLWDRCSELALVQKQLGELAVRDSLTGLYNGRYLKELLKDELDRTKRGGSKLSVVICDIDHFDDYVEERGQDKGDDCLVVAAHLFGQLERHRDQQDHTRDILARYGVSEFAIVFPKLDKLGAAGMAERARRLIEARDFPNAEGLRSGRLTMSAGVAGFPEDGASRVELLDCADRALSQAREEGCNRVCLFTE